VKIEDPDDLLFPDMVAQITFLGPEQPKAGEKPSLRVPKQALRREGAEASVFVAAGGRAQRRKVDAGDEAGDLVAIRNGLASGERVILTGVESLQDGQAIEEER
jgi:hypothetical protein